MVQLAAFPKCYLDDIILHKSMTVLEWIEKASQLGVDGLEMYDLFFAGAEEAYLDAVQEKCAQAGLAIPMMCFSPDFTNPDPQVRLEELEKQKRAIDLTVRLGGRFCRTLSGQNRPGLEREKAVGWCVEMIRQPWSTQKKRRSSLRSKITTRTGIGNILNLRSNPRSFWKSSSRSTRLISGSISTHPIPSLPEKTPSSCCRR